MELSPLQGSPQGDLNLVCSPRLEIPVPSTPNISRGFHCHTWSFGLLGDIESMPGSLCPRMISRPNISGLKKSPKFSLNMESTTCVLNIFGYWNPAFQSLQAEPCGEGIRASLWAMSLPTQAYLPHTGCRSQTHMLGVKVRYIEACLSPGCIPLRSERLNHLTVVSSFTRPQLDFE